MKRDLNKFTRGSYDVLIIGGGINGAAVANTASLNGLSVALIEKDDFASGTSSKSTKLVHGGLRYLENFEFDLVREALVERSIQIKSAPHLVKPLAFIIPVTKSDPRPLWMMRLGVFLYDFLSGKYLVEKHRSLSIGEILQLIPGLNAPELLGGVMYYDAQMDDARLCLENVLQADYHGAHAANYVEAVSLIKELGKARGVVARDRLTGKTFEIKSKKIVCCVGPWTNIFMGKEKSQSPQKVRTTKGVHLVYQGQICPHALLFSTKKDKRVFFIIPWLGNSLIGTTDTDFTGSPDAVSVTEGDVDYLLEEAAKALPLYSFKRENIITTFAGLRPLVYQEGSPAHVSRKHVIRESYSGIFYVMGGKYTTYRSIAEDCVKRLIKTKLIDTQQRYPLYGGGKIEEHPDRVAEEFNVPPAVVSSLMGIYGSRYKDVLGLVKKDTRLKEPITGTSPVIKAQVKYAIETEMACKAEDILWRRLSLGYTQKDLSEVEAEIKKMLL